MEFYEVLRQNSLQLIAVYQQNPSVRLRNALILSYDRLIWKWVRQMVKWPHYQDAYQFVCYKLLLYVGRNPHYELDAYIRILIPKSLLVFREQINNYKSQILIEDLNVDPDNGDDRPIKDLAFIKLAVYYQTGRSPEESEIWEIVENTLKNAPQQLLVARKIWRDGWSVQDVEKVYRMGNKQVNTTLVKAKKKVREALKNYGYELPTKQSDRSHLHQEIIRQRQQGLGPTALAKKFGYTRDGINKILQKYDVA